MVIRIDSREKLPLAFEKCEVVRGTIPIFDYSIQGDQHAFAVERKGRQDCIQSLAITGNFSRELKKIKRAKAAGIHPLFYIVEADRADIEYFDYSRFKSGRVTPEFIFHKISILEYFHDVHFIFSGDALGAARDVYRILKRRAEDLQAQEGDL